MKYLYCNRLCINVAAGNIWGYEYMVPILYFTLQFVFEFAFNREKRTMNFITTCVESKRFCRSTAITETLCMRHFHVES